MTAAKVMDDISWLLGAADAVSAYTQVKMEDAPTLQKIPQSECPDICIRLPKHKWPKSWSNMEDPVVFLLNGICTVILWLDYCGNGNSRKFHWNTVGKKFQIVNAYSSTEEKGLFSSVHVDDIKMSVEKQNILFGLHSNEKVKSAKILWIITEVCSKQGFPPRLQKHCRNDIFMVQWHGRSCKEMRGKILRAGQQNNSVTVQSRNSMPLWPSIQRRSNNSTTYLLHASMTTTLKRKTWNLLENCQKYALNFFWNFCIWHVLVQ